MEITLNAKAKKKFLMEIIIKACGEDGIEEIEFETNGGVTANFTVHKIEYKTVTTQGILGTKQEVKKSREQILEVKAAKSPYNTLFDDEDWNKITVNSAQRKYDHIASKVAEILDQKEVLITLALNLPKKNFNPSTRF